MSTSVRVLLTLANLSFGQGPGIVPDPPATVEIIQPAPFNHDSASQTASEAHAPDMPAPSEPRLWITAEYLLWWNKMSRIPPLITTGLSTDKLPGALSDPNTRILYGGSVDYHERNGGRFAAGYLLDDENRFGLEGGYLFLGSRATVAQQTSDTSVAGYVQVLARPFFDVLNNRQDSSLSAYPGLISGTVSVRSTNRLEAAETNFSLKFGAFGRLQLDALAGFRYWHLQEDLGIEENTTVSMGAPVFAGNSIKVNDFFGTENSFYGGQLGLRGRLQYERLHLDVITKIALGASQEVAAIRGATSIDTMPATAFNAGLLALASNSGRFFHEEFTAIPEIGVNLGFRVTNNIDVFAGYTFMYWANVLRPGDQIDTNLNPHLIPTSNSFGTAGGPARPAAVLRESGFWAQGLNVGIELRY